MKKLFQIIVLLAMATIEVPALRAQSPTITVFQGLTFGMSLGNTTNTVAPTDPTAAAFLIQVPGYTMSKYAYASINVSITLPYSLTAGGSHTMNVSYSTNSACWNTTNSFSGITYFGPSSGINQQIYANTPLNLYIWIGGTAAPGGSWLPSGNYTGTISVTAKVSVSKPKASYTASQTIPVTASVIQGLSLSETGSLDFGQIIAGTTPAAISAQSGSAPELTAAGSGGKSMTVSYASSIPISDMYGNTITFLPSLYGSSLSTGQAGATAVASQTAVTLSGTSGQTGYYYFWLGGSIAPVPASQPAGAYSGTFTVTVNY